jgi:hypothetical protein
MLDGEQPYKERPAFLAERQADSAYAQGRFNHALQTLRTAKRAFNYVHNEHFFRLKELAAPLYVAFYELNTEGVISETTREEMQDVHAYAVDAMPADLENYREAENKHRQDLYKGALSEKVIFALGARGFNAHGRRFILPASAEANVDEYRPRDFHVITLPDRYNDYHLSQRAIQVKTSNGQSGTKENGVSIVGLRQIDRKGPVSKNNTSYPIDHEDALPSIMVREIDGTSTNNEINHLNYVTQRMYRHIFPPVRIKEPPVADDAERAAS